jgi:hypothetical protein
MSQKIKQIFFLVLFISFSFEVFSYVPCDDYVGCPDDRICCRASDGGFSCCYYTRVCCMNATRCCEKESSMKFLIENWISSVAADKPLNLLPKDNINTQIIDTIKEKEIKEMKIDSSWENIKILVDSFLSETKFYENFRNLSNCGIDMERMIFKSKEVYMIIEQLYKENITIENVSKLLEALSEFFEFAGKSLNKCKEIRGDIDKIVQKIHSHFNDPDIQFKFIYNLMRNEKEIRDKIEEIKLTCNEKKYEKCGKTLGDLFSIVVNLE